MSEKSSTVRDLPASSFILSAAIMRYLTASSVSWRAHPDLACPTECCELIANEEQVVHDNIHLEFACKGREHFYSVK